MINMAAGGRNPQKSAVARARAQARADQEGAGGGGAAGAKGRQFDQGAADVAQVKRDQVKALRAEREKKAAADAAREAKVAAKLKKENDAKQKGLGLEVSAKQARAYNDAKNDTAEAPAAAEDSLCDAFEGLDLSEKYGHDWSMTEVQNDKITKKQVVDYMDANASDEFKAANGLPVSKSGLKKTTKDVFVQTYAKLLKECPK